MGMDVSDRIAVSGMVSYQRQIDAISNNLANLGTTAFKRAHATSTDIGYQAGLTAPVGPNGANVRIQGVGEGTQIADTAHDFAGGDLQPTGNPFDLALAGDGFFEVSLPGTQVGYTRDGSLGFDSTNTLVTADGFPVRSDAGTPITIPANAAGARVDETGQVLATDANDQESLVARLAISQFKNPAGLLANGQNIWVPTTASGAAAAVSFPDAQAPVVVSGALEGSNVDVGDEFTRLLQAQRGYQMNVRVEQAWDEVARMANELRH